MKLRGKIFNQVKEEDLKIKVGTVDKDNLNSIYFDISFWLEPSEDLYDYTSYINKLKYNITEVFYKKNSLFKNDFIKDDNIKEYLLSDNKKTFIKMNYTMYLNETLNHNNNELHNYINDIVYNIKNELKIFI